MINNEDKEDDSGVPVVTEHDQITAENSRAVTTSIFPQHSLVQPSSKYQAINHNLDRERELEETHIYYQNKILTMERQQKMMLQEQQSFGRNVISPGEKELYLE